MGNVFSFSIISSAGNIVSNGHYHSAGREICCQNHGFMFSKTRLRKDLFLRFSHLSLFITFLLSLFILYYTSLYCTVLYSTVLYCTVLYCTVLYFTVLYCTSLYCTSLYCTSLYCTLISIIVHCCHHF